MVLPIDTSNSLMRVIHQAFSTVADTADIPWEVRRQILTQMCRAVWRYATAYAEPENCAEWCRMTLEDLPGDERITPVHRIALAGWFAGEVLSHLTGDFDSKEAAD